MREGVGATRRQARWRLKAGQVRPMRQSGCCQPTRRLADDSSRLSAYAGLKAKAFPHTREGKIGKMEALEITCRASLYPEGDAACDRLASYLQEAALRFLIACTWTFVTRNLAPVASSVVCPACCPIQFSAGRAVAKYTTGIPDHSGMLTPHSR